MSRGKLSQAGDIILGLDPGLAVTGWGVIENSKLNHQWEVVDYGVIKTQAGLAKKERLQKIYLELRKLIQNYQPDEIALEEVFFGKNAKTALLVGEARGIAILAGAQTGVNLREFTPLQVKMTTTGYGRADKQQIQIMVQKLLGLKIVPKPDDAADALAVALTAAVTHDYQAYRTS